MSERLFDWCAGQKPDQYHSLCPIEYTTQFGVTHRCSCPGHRFADGDEKADNRTSPQGVQPPAGSNRQSLPGTKGAEG